MRYVNNTSLMKILMNTTANVRLFCVSLPNVKILSNLMNLSDALNRYNYFFISTRHRETVSDCRVELAFRVRLFIYSTPASRLISLRLEVIRDNSSLRKFRFYRIIIDLYTQASFVLKMLSQSLNLNVEIQRIRMIMYSITVVCFCILSLICCL